ncbi:hypothetical protein CIB48_g11141 [Xylaria polymorpha]|nr:hypothetical protein CIB48_g11141 [Xylaria polymorpha]
MEPVEKLFRALPSPAADQATLDQLGAWDEAHFGRVFLSFFPSSSRDPDRERSLRSESKPSPRPMSLQRCALKYHAWISHGRKDEEHPFKNTECSEGQPVDLPKDGHAFLPAKLTDPKICANCAKPDTDAACSGCLVNMDSHVVMKTTCCNKACQTQHWKEHKSQCLGRRKVCRAVSLLYDLFAMFQKKAWIDEQVVGITEKQGITKIIHHQLDEWALQGKPFVCCFPSGIAPSEEHALAVLFDTLCRTLQEVQLMPRNAHRPTCDMRYGRAHNTMYNQHAVLCATLKSGEKMAVDIAGAQFGWRETVAQWGVWTSHRVAGKPCPQPFGYAQQCMQTLYPFAAPEFNTMKENKAPSAGELYKLDDAAFASCKVAMLSNAEEALDSGLNGELRESKVGLCYVDARGLWQATTTKQQAKALKRVWLTDKDVKMAKDKGTDLRLIYQLRCKNQGKDFMAAGLDMP